MEGQKDTTWWHNQLELVTANAVSKRHVLPLETTTLIISELGANWIIRYASTLKLKPSKATDKKTDFNPFLPYDPNLYLGTIFGTHNVLLNKFNVVPKHILLTTVNFESQHDLLTKQDFLVTWFATLNWNALSFYNSGEESGASQPHKHVQVIPLPITSNKETVNDDSEFPIEPLLRRNYKHKGIQVSQIFQLDEFPFDHGCIRLSPPCDTSKDLPNPQAENIIYLYQCYTQLYNQMKLEKGTARSSYNFIMTSEWMIIVPRKYEKFKNISVNSIGFAGTILVKSEEDLLLLKEVGPIKILSELGFTDNRLNQVVANNGSFIQ